MTRLGIMLENIETVFFLIVMVKLQKICLMHLKTQWKTYRQQLRDLPNKMIAAGVHPNFADMMFPMEPKFQDPPHQGILIQKQ